MLQFHDTPAGKMYQLSQRPSILAVRVIDRLDEGPDGLGHYVAPRENVGDIIGSILWPKNTREISAWNFAWASVRMGKKKVSGTHAVAPNTPGAGIVFVTGDVPQLRQETKDGKASEEEKKQARCSSIPESETGLILPVSGIEMSPDREFALIDAARPFTQRGDLWPKFPRGWYGITVAATQVFRQVECFMPTDPRLVAVNAAGDWETGSMVCDTTRGHEVDPERIARLQTMMWVVKIRKLVAPPPPAASHDTGTGGKAQEAASGDQSSLPYLERRLANFPLTQEGFAAAIHRGDIPKGSTFETFETAVYAAREAEKNPGEPASPDLARGGGGPAVCLEFGKNLIAWNIGPTGCREARGGAIIDLREGIPADASSCRPDGAAVTTTSPAAATASSTAAQPDDIARTIGMASSKQTGPLDVGHDDDKHQIDRDDDGNPINSAHISTGAFFRKPGSKVLDAPILFEGEYDCNEMEPQCGDQRMRVHLQYFGRRAKECPSPGSKNRSMPPLKHPFLCGVRDGYWALWAESKFGNDTTNGTTIEDGEIGQGVAKAIAPELYV